MKAQNTILRYFALHRLKFPTLTRMREILVEEHGGSESCSDNSVGRAVAWIAGEEDSGHHSHAFSCFLLV